MNGPTSGPIAPKPNAADSSTSGSTPTTITAATPPSAATHQSPASTTSRVTTASPRPRRARCAASSARGRGAESGLRAQQRGELGGRHRSRQQETLRAVATEPTQAVELLLRLNAFRGDRDVECVRHVHHGACDGGALAVRGEVGDERAVELDLVDREAVQVRQRRVARAEVVDRELDAELLQVVEHLARIGD